VSSSSSRNATAGPQPHRSARARPSSSPTSGSAAATAHRPLLPPNFSAFIALHLPACPLESDADAPRDETRERRPSQAAAAAETDRRRRRNAGLQDQVSVRPSVTPLLCCFLITATPRARWIPAAASGGGWILHRLILTVVPFLGWAADLARPRRRATASRSRTRRRRAAARRQPPRTTGRASRPCPRRASPAMARRARPTSHPVRGRPTARRPRPRPPPPPASPRLRRYGNPRRLPYHHRLRFAGAETRVLFRGIQTCFD